MNLDNLKTTWKIYKTQNSLGHLSREDILSIIEEPIHQRFFNLPRLFTNVVFFLLLSIVCQGG